MRLAILTDIHANREAFAAVLADVNQRGADMIVLLGDIVGYGPDPVWCTEKAAMLVASGAICVKGNHDSAASGGKEHLHIIARKAIEWTTAQLSVAHKSFLASLPLTDRRGEVLFVHASANAPGDWIYVTSDTKATGSFRSVPDRLIFCGHVHKPGLFSCDGAGMVKEQNIPIGKPIPLIKSRRWLAVIGAVGQPRDGLPAAHYATLDTATNDLTFRRVPYDTAMTAQKLRAVGLPEELAIRLMKGA